MIAKTTTLPIALLALSLAACAGSKTPPPAIAYDSDDFAPATRAAEPPRPVAIVTLPEPLPLPGQLKPAPGSSRTQRPLEPAEPTERVAQANAEARIEPSRDGYVNAIQVWPYSGGALYQVYTAPGRVTDVQLQPGEQLVSVAAGDTVRWVLGDTASGQGEDRRVSVLVKPIRPDLPPNNLVIKTDRRSYHLELHATPETYMASVSWHYPHAELASLRARNAVAEAAQDVTVDEGLRLERLRFRYAISGGDPPWRPVRVFDDSRKVYIQFPRRLDQGEAPPLFVVGPRGDAELVNYRVRGNYYIVDRLFAAAELRLGQDPQQVVRITRTDGRETAP